MRADLAGLSLGISQTHAQLFGETVQDPAGKPVRRDVHFNVELRELGLEIAARDALEDLLVHHARQPVAVGEIEFDLQPHEIAGTVEPLLLQQSFQPQQALLELPAVPLAVGQVEPRGRDLFPHRRSFLEWAVITSCPALRSIRPPAPVRSR